MLLEMRSLGPSPDFYCDTCDIFHDRADGHQGCQPEKFYKVLDVGIRETVRLLHVLGFATSDSGDGVSKPPPGRVLEFPHVAVCSKPASLLEDARRLRARLEGEIGDLTRRRRSLRGGGEKAIAIEASYSPIDDSAIIMLMGLDDRLLRLMRSARERRSRTPGTRRS